MDMTADIGTSVPLTETCAPAMVVFSLAIWTLNHEFRPDLDALKEITTMPDGNSLGTRRSTRRRIWNITKILCYAITLLTIAFSYYRFFP